MDRDFKKQEKRIKSVFPKDCDDIFKREETLEIYKTFLNSHLEFPVKLTGIEDFSWEEFYVLGPGSKTELKPTFLYLTRVC